MAEKQNWLSKFKLKFPLKNKNTLLIAGIAILCVVALFFGSISSKNKSSNNTSSTQSTTYTFDALEYANQVGQTLQDTINNIEGVSNAKVVVVVQQSPKVEYLTQTSNSELAVVYIKNGSIYQPVVVTQFLPQITGILVVADGVNNLQIRNNLLNAISAVYNVNISCIDILEGK